MGRPLLSIVLGLFTIAIGAILIFSYLDRKTADQSHVTQAALERIEARAQELNHLAWLGIIEQELTTELLAEGKTNRQELFEAVTALRRQRLHGRTTDQIDPLVENYVQAADRRWRLVTAGQLEEARRVDFEEVSPQFEALQHELDEAGAAEEHWANGIAQRGRNKFLAAVGLSAAAIFILFLWFERQNHLTKVILAERAALQHSEERFRALTEKSTDVVFITDPAGVVNYVSPSVETVLGLKDDVFTGRSLGEFVSLDDAPKLKTSMRAIDGENEVVELRLQHLNGAWLCFECVVRNLLKVENINGLVFNAREITQRKKAEEQLLFHASHDQLTGLPNRVHFLNRLQTVIDRIQRHRQQMSAVLFVDVDDFKVVNDCLGHAAGDELIVEFGNRLKTCMRSDGSVARMGGDEFTVLLEDVTDPSDAIRVAQRIHAAVDQPFLLLGQEVCKDVSIGIALVSQDSSAEMTVRNADIAMYRAKSKGKGRTELFDAAMHEQVMGQLQLEVRLRRALQNCELSLHYQPIVDLQTGLIEGFEALLRWQPPDDEPVSPGVFIPVAERSGLIVPISRWVLAASCKEAASWLRRYPSKRPLYVSINVSPRHFSHPAFIRHVKEALASSGIPPRCVKIELTESVAMNDAPSTEGTMSQLRALGVGLSIDDFGTGYSSLSYLRRFPVDTLKIDRSFVAAMQADRENLAIVSTVVALGRNLGLEVVAEGVETTSQLEKLRAIGCDAAQGYLFAKAMPSEEIFRTVDCNRRQVDSALFEATIEELMPHS